MPSIQSSSTPRIPVDPFAGGEYGPLQSNSHRILDYYLPVAPAQSFGVILVYGRFDGMRTLSAVKTHAQKTLNTLQNTDAMIPTPSHDVVQTV